MRTGRGPREAGLVETDPILAPVLENPETPYRRTRGKRREAQETP